jgi:DNA helicase-2/ATP-dependent DNA helicase PcrA
MDKKIILAAAGSGKTTYLVNQISKESRSLIITHTIANKLNLRESIIRKFGFFPENIRIQTYFSFLYSFCIQPFLMNEYKLKGLNYNYKYNQNWYEKGDKRYLTNTNRLYHNRAAKFIDEKNLSAEIKIRLEKYYQYLYIDEVQDFAGHDFNLLRVISQSNINALYVGDFYQHTFDTSRDGRVNEGLHDNYEEYKNKFRKLNFDVDERTLIKSYRCSPQVCQYIHDKLNINIESRKCNTTEITYIDNKARIENIMINDDIVKLFFKEHYLYQCRSRNWGDSKGENKYNDVCVVLNKETLNHYRENRLFVLKNQTLNKLYVAISRAHGNVYFIAEKDIQEYKRKK